MRCYKVTSYAFLVISISYLAGCSPPQPLNFSVQGVQPSPARVDADLRTITVTPGAPNERTGNLPPAVAGLTNNWKEATQEALARSALFNDDSHRHVNLEIKLLKFDVPGMGITFPTDTDASYTIVDRQDGSVIFREIVSAQGTTPMNFALMGAIRARESINRSAQNNISAFLRALEVSPVAIPRSARPNS